MSFARRRGVHGRSLAVQAWPVWSLPRWLAGYVVLVTALYVAAIGVARVSTVVRPGNLLLFGVLLACDAGTVEMTRRAGENAGLVKDVYAVWELPAAILLPPMYALLVPIPRILLTQWRVRRISVYRRVFNAAAIGLSYASASFVFHSIFRTSTAPTAGSGTHATALLLAVAACAPRSSGR